jgi:hypothetical protein
MGLCAQMWAGQNASFQAKIWASLVMLAQEKLADEDDEIREMAHIVIGNSGEPPKWLKKLAAFLALDPHGLDVDSTDAEISTAITNNLPEIFTMAGIRKFEPTP